MKIRSVKFTAKQTLCLMISLAFGSLVLVEISWYGSRYGDRPTAINNQQWKYVSNLFIGKAWTRRPISTEGKSSSDFTHDSFIVDQFRPAEYFFLDKMLKFYKGVWVKRSVHTNFECHGRIFTMSFELRN